MTFHKHVRVQRGGIIQIEDPELPEGDAEVTIELAAETPAPVYEDARVLFEEIARITASVPEEEWDRLPSDLALNLDHHLHGWPKAEE